MSIELVRFRATRSSPEIRVIVAATEAQRATVYALRHDVYVAEMGLLDPTHPYVRDGAVRDPWDDQSLLLLATVDGAAVGTMRLTPAAAGPMEIERYRSLDDLPDPRATLCEATRYMVRRSWRKSPVGLALLIATMRAMSLSGLRTLISAGKLGSLSRYYQAVGLSRVGTDTFTYDLVGTAPYELLRLDIGASGTLRRMYWHAFTRMLHLVGGLLGKRERIFGKAGRRTGAPDQVQWTGRDHRSRAFL